MKAFAITWDGVYQNVLVGVCPDLETAKGAVEGSRSNGGIAAASAIDLDKPGPQLVGLYNALLDSIGSTNTRPKKFETRADGQRRIFELLEQNFKDAPEVAAPSTVDDGAATTNEDDMATKGKTKKAKKIKAPKVKKVKVAKAPRVKKEKAAPKPRKLKAAVASKGGEKAKASALELISRKNGATAPEIAEKLDVSLGTAKNLVWYLRRDGHKIVVNKDSERKPYVID